MTKKYYLTDAEWHGRAVKVLHDADKNVQAVITDIHVANNLVDYLNKHARLVDARIDIEILDENHPFITAIMCLLVGALGVFICFGTVLGWGMLIGAFV